MESHYKIIYRDESGAKGAVSLPPFLIENRKELWRAAFRDATARLQTDLEGVPAEELQLLVKELSAKHLGYFNEYLDGRTNSRSIVESTEQAWAVTLDEAILKRLGHGDVDAGVSEVLIAISLIADDEMEPLIKAYERIRSQGKQGGNL